MRHTEGLRITPIEEGMLDSAGILKNNGTNPTAFGLSDEAVQLFLLIATAGDDGMPRSHLFKSFQALQSARDREQKFPKLAKDEALKRIEDLFAEHLLQLELQTLVAWERDKRGRLAYLVITWKGSEVIAAQRSRVKQASWSSRRKASMGSAATDPKHSSSV